MPSILIMIYHRIFKIIQIMQYITITFLTSLLYVLATTNPIILATADFTNYQSSGNPYSANFAGVSVYFSQIYLAAMNTTFFQGFFGNSKAFGSFSSMFSMSLKMQSPKGYKYDCSAYTPMGINATCVYSWTASMTKLTPFVKAAAPYTTYQFTIGFDMENANFNNTAFTSYFTAMNSALLAGPGVNSYQIPIQVFDGADQYTANGIFSNYTSANFVSDMNAILALNTQNRFYGPGISQSADPSWLATYNTFRGNPYVFFTVKCVIFNATNNFTIADVLNQSNYRSFILNRFTYNGMIINPIGGNLVITEAKLTNGNGIDGVTNSFAAALWAIDFSIEFAMFGGKNIKFLCDLTAGNLQTVLGPSPTFTPRPIYYGLLFLTTLSYVSPIIGMPTVTAGVSSSIKIYGFTISQQMQIVMINKDINPNASGVVKIVINSIDQMECLYLSAPTLASTSNVTWAGYTFNNNSNIPQGNFTTLQYFPSSNGSYYIPLNYSQAVICYLGNPANNFTTAAKGQYHLQVILPILFLIFALCIL